MSDEPTPGAEPLREFLSEGEEIIEKLGRDLIALDRLTRHGEGGAGAAGGVDPELLNNIFRGAHSLKGLSGMFGFTGLATVSHNLENLLDALRLGKVPLDAPILDLLFAGLDLLGRQMKALSGAGGGEEGGAAPDEREIEAFIARLNAAAGRSAGRSGSLAGIDPAILNVLTEFEEHRLEENLRMGRALYRAHVSFDLATFDQGLAELTARLKPLGELITTLPGSAGAGQGRIDIDIVVGSDRPLADLQAAVEGLGVTVSPLATPAAAPAREEPAAAPAPTERP
ncbi:MAG TPA: Hpt domain-containing protein, partial [Thermodesulfobacteriota bacterium]|nr:Hpt domain-containing protein [Thermodesulfobacteriota bacterium]